MSYWLRISVSFQVMLLFVPRWFHLMCISKKGPELEEDTFRKNRDFIHCLVLGCIKFRESHYLLIKRLASSQAVDEQVMYFIVKIMNYKA